jgi:hypothetical protein
MRVEKVKEESTQDDSGLAKLAVEIKKHSEGDKLRITDLPDDVAGMGGANIEIALRNFGVQARVKRDDGALLITFVKDITLR